MKPSDRARPSTSSTLSKNGDAFGTVLGRVAAGMLAEMLSGGCGMAMLISRGMSSVVLLHGRDLDRVCGGYLMVSGLRRTQRSSGVDEGRISRGGIVEQGVGCSQSVT